ncbi:MAG: NAD-dependent dehydratase, partial [Actinobacteria bacterium]|nr:NAD-dependent dehydratase [Actinomycetota bacterium]
HQKRGFLPLRDSMQCLTLAIEKPPEPGEYRVFNQFDEVYDLTDLAEKVSRVADDLGLKPEIRNLVNPRDELEDHYYNPEHQKLIDLGYVPPHSVEDEVAIMLEDLVTYRARIEARRAVLVPDVQWTGRREPVSYLRNDEALVSG